MKNVLTAHLTAIWILVACTNPAATTTSISTVPATFAPPTTIPTATAPPTSTIAPTPTVFAPEVPEFPDPGSGEPAGPEESAGLYKPPAAFSIPFTFETKAIYRGFYEEFPEAQIFGIAQGTAMFPPKKLLFFAVKPNYAADEVLTELRMTKNMTSTEIQAVVVGGISGREFDATTEGVIYIPAFTPFVGHESAGGDWSTDSPKDHLRFIVCSISSRTLMIFIEAPQEDWDAFLLDANQVLSTVKFAANTP